MPEGVDLLAPNGAPLELAGRVALEGELLFDDDPSARVRWVADTRKIWLDERPRFERAHRDYLDAVARSGSDREAAPWSAAARWEENRLRSRACGSGLDWGVEFRRLPVLDNCSTNEMLGYDDNGIPT